MIHTIRPLTPNDYPRVVELYDMVEPNQLTVEDLIQQDEPRPGSIMQGHVAVSEDGCVVGYISAYHRPWMPERTFGIRLVVEPAFRGQGIGNKLYALVGHFLNQHRADTIETEVRDNDPTSLRFAESKGFCITGQRRYSALDLEVFDGRPYLDLLKDIEATGIRFFTMADVEWSEENLHKLYELDCLASVDIPSFSGVLTPFEDFKKIIFEAPWAFKDGILVAGDGDRWIGVAFLAHHKQSNMMYNNFTGVDPDYRGRKIAQALKVLAIQCAQRYGVKSIGTGNDLENGPMLAINRKMGYREVPGAYLLKLEVGKGAVDERWRT